jgi:hypothetical protein
MSQLTTAKHLRSMDDTSRTKLVCEIIDITSNGNPNGFVAPGARVKEHPELEEEVARIGALKCQRCRNYHTVQGNPMDCCDRCVLTVTQMVPELVASGAWTQESADEWKALVQASVNRWKAKT